MENSKFKKVMLAAAISVVSTNAPASEQNSELSLGNLVNIYEVNIYEQVSGEELIVAKRRVKQKQKQKQKQKAKKRFKLGMAENDDKGFLV